MIFLCQSAQNCIISHKISHKFSVDVAQSPPQTLPILHLLCCASTPRLRRSLDAFGILVSAPRWLKPPPHHSKNPGCVSGKKTATNACQYCREPRLWECHISSITCITITYLIINMFMLCSSRRRRAVFNVDKIRFRV